LVQVETALARAPEETMNQKEEDKRRFDEFVRLEEDREQERREKKREGERRCELEAQQRQRVVDLKELEKQKKAAQREQLKRIMDEAQRSFAERAKKQYDLTNPPMGEVEWLVFDRATGELLGEAKAWRAYGAWASVNPTQSFPACRCVQREDWEAAEQKFRNRKKNGNGAGR
jgi:hypothetical protein